MADIFDLVAQDSYILPIAITATATTVRLPLGTHREMREPVRLILGNEALTVQPGTGSVDRNPGGDGELLNASAAPGDTIITVQSSARFVADSSLGLVDHARMTEGATISEDVVVTDVISGTQIRVIRGSTPQTFTLANAPRIRLIGVSNFWEVLFVARGQEGTTAEAHPKGDRLARRWTTNDVQHQRDAQTIYPLTMFVAYPSPTFGSEDNVLPLGPTSAAELRQLQENLTVHDLESRIIFPTDANTRVGVNCAVNPSHYGWSQLRVVLVLSRVADVAGAPVPYPNRVEFIATAPNANGGFGLIPFNTFTPNTVDVQPVSGGEYMDLLTAGWYRAILSLRLL